MALSTTKAAPQAPMLTIIGFPGVGKSTLAALFPNPIFIQAESATTVFEKWDVKDQPDFFAQLPSANAKRNVRPTEILMGQLRELMTQEHDRKTVIIDTITSLNMLIEQEIIAFNSDVVDNIGEACGGFGKGYLAVANKHAEIRTACEHLRKRGIAVVFLAHSGIVKTKNRPDAEAYTTWSIDMHEASRRVYIAQLDAVLYVKSKEHVLGSESDKRGNIKKYGKLVSTGDRVIITASEGTIGYVDAKNRYDMPAEIELPEFENPLLQYIPFFNTNAKEEVQS